MFAQISYYPILGKPLILWLGIITLSFFILTALIGVLTMKGIKRFSIKWHIRMAMVSIALALIHGILGISAYL